MKVDTVVLKYRLFNFRWNIHGEELENQLEFMTKEQLELVVKCLKPTTGKVKKHLDFYLKLQKQMNEKTDKNMFNCYVTNLNFILQRLTN